MQQTLFHIPLLGKPVYGFGTMLLLGFVFATWVACRRARREGIASKRIEDAALVILLGGILGARALFVVQYDELFFGDGVLNTLWKIVNLSEGGLVWYGAVLGAVVAFTLFVWRTRLPALKMCDLLAPTVMLGLAFGRIGCFLNGCCYGDETSLPWAVHFPADPPSVPYKAQLDKARRGEGPKPPVSHSLAVHPTQLYSSLNALILFAVLSAYYPFRRWDGQVVGLLMLLYPLTRFLIEFLRNDELPKWGTGLTISQNLSVLAFLAGVLWMLWLRSRQGKRSNRQDTAGRRQQAGAGEPATTSFRHSATAS